tara:strand:- start:654 stop:839 length:186 start_codon:yes stop_codon:yes gene_type:complete
MNDNIKKKILNQLLDNSTPMKEMGILSILSKYEIIEKEIVDEILNEKKEGKILLFPKKHND